MNEEERASQVSALFDGQLDESQSELVLRRMRKDPALRAAWSRYAVIGASLRREPLSVGSLGRGDVAARVAGALALEPELPAAAPLPDAARGRFTAGATRALWGGALAAGVAAASILVVRMQVPTGEPLAPQLVQAPAPVLPAPAVAGTLPEPAPAARATAEAAPSYTTPVTSGRNAGLPAPLVNYVVAHSEYLTPVMRFNPLSAVMMGTFEPGEELVEATEAEIGAVRR